MQRHSEVKSKKPNENKEKRRSNINNVCYSVYYCELYDWSENKLFVLYFVFVHPGAAVVSPEATTLDLFKT